MSLEFNKIAASVLTAGVVAMGSGFVGGLLIQPRQPDEPAYTVAPREAPTEVADDRPVGPEPILHLIADADISAGESARRACAACHTFEEGGANRVGPNLYGIMGNEIAAVEGFNYSDALLEKRDEEGTWDYRNMNAFLHDPDGWAPGTRMAYAGLTNTDERANLIAYMREQDNDPIPLPEEDEIEAVLAEWEGEEEEAEVEEPVEEDEAAEADGLAARLQQADADAGESAVRACAACHSFEEGGGNRVGPNLYNVVGSEIASAEDFGNYSSTLQEMDDVWSYENLDAFLEDPRGWAPGTTMAFAGVGDPQDRANIIAYLRRMSDDPPELPEANGGNEDDRADASGNGAEEAEAADRAEAASEEAEAAEQAGAAVEEAEAAEEAAEAEAASAESEAAASAETGEARAATDADSNAQASNGNGVLTRIRAADASRGEQLARACVACHSFEEGGPNKVGPNLHGVVGADIATHDGFSYSNALASKQGNWTYENLDTFLEDPRGWAPGTRMTYAGVKDPEDRAAIIAYLAQQSNDAPSLD